MAKATRIYHKSYLSLAVDHSKLTYATLNLTVVNFQNEGYKNACNSPKTVYSWSCKANTINFMIVFVLSCAVCWTIVSIFGNLVTKTATSQNALCLPSSVSQIH